MFKLHRLGELFSCSDAVANDIIRVLTTANTFAITSLALLALSPIGNYSLITYIKLYILTFRRCLHKIDRKI